MTAGRLAVAWPRVERRSRSIGPVDTPLAAAVGVAAVVAFLVGSTAIGGGDYGQWLMVSRGFGGLSTPAYRDLSQVPPLAPALIAFLRATFGDGVLALHVLAGLITAAMGCALYLAGWAVGRRSITGLLAVVLGLLVSDQYLELLTFGALPQALAVVFLTASIGCFARAMSSRATERRWWLGGCATLFLACLSHVPTATIALPACVVAATFGLVPNPGETVGSRLRRAAPLLLGFAAIGVYWVAVIAPASVPYVANPASLSYRGPDRLLSQLLGYPPTAAIVIAGVLVLAVQVAWALREIALRRLPVANPRTVVAAWALTSWAAFAASAVGRAATDYPRFAPLLVVPFLFAALALPCGSRQYHWDTLERAYLLEHAQQYLRSWDGSPRSQFLSFAHVLELPAAGLVRTVLGGGSGIRALTVMEVVAGVCTLALLAALVRFWGGGAGAAVAAQAVLATSWAFWKMGTSGEERILALATVLFFLLCFWRALAGAGRVVHAGITLGLAVLAHTSAFVLVPFAFAALLFLPAEWKVRRAGVARALAAGAVVAGTAYAGIAAWTTHVRTPRQLYAYATFFHRDAGNQFFEPPGHASATRGAALETGGPGAATAGPGVASRPRILRVAHGFVSFFGSPGFPGGPALALLALAFGAARALGTRTSAPPPRRPAPDAHRAADGARGHVATSRPFLGHTALLAGMWTAHFAFYEPENTESWTVPAALVILVAAVAAGTPKAAAAGVGGRAGVQGAAQDPRAAGPGRTALAGVAPFAGVTALAGAALLLLLGNARAFAALHAPMPLARYHAAVRRAAAPGDIVLLVGGIQNGQPLRGSISMRYFLAAEHERTVASLYDVLQITAPEYWGHPVPSVEALQQALGSGRRAWFPAFLEPDFAAANRSGLVRMTWAARGDSVFEITRVERP